MKRKGATLQRTAIAVLSILLAVSIGVTAGATSYRTLTLTGVGHIAKLVRGNAQLLGEDLTVSACLVEHIHEAVSYTHLDVYKRQ